MIASVIDCVAEASTSSSNYGVVFKNFIAQLVANIPFLSIDTENTDTNSVYDVTLAYSFDDTTKVQLRNQTGTVYGRGIVNGTNLAETNTTGNLFSGNAQLKIKIFLTADTAVVLWTSGSGATYNAYPIVFGKVHNIYDSNTPTLIPRLSSPGSAANFASVYVGSTTAAEVSPASAYATPAGIWGGEGHVYTAVPQCLYNSNAAYPVSAFFGDETTLYRLYDNGSTAFSFSQGEIVIGGHTFYVLPRESGNYVLALRIN